MFSFALVLKVLPENRYSILDGKEHSLLIE